jgi:NAD(P)H-hydrate repair Nnr-like enzyme with NAD(P)H-hydrate dehydratase domain
VEEWAAAAKISNSYVVTGGGSPKVAGAPLLCGGAAGGIGVGVVLMVGCGRGALASSSQLLNSRSPNRARAHTHRHVRAL